MSSATLASSIGCGAATLALSREDLRAIVSQALADIAPGERVLAIVPDKTRDDNTDQLVPFAAEILSQKKVGRFDAVIAQGTHGPMSEAEKREKIGWSKIAPGILGRIFDHQWDREDELVTIGELTAARVADLTGGLMHESVQVRINALLTPGRYDTVLVFGATMPHEVAGFAGGAKYLFPGVAGPELTHLTHWLGALATIENVIGRAETPTRHVIEAAAAFVSARVISFTSVSTRSSEGLQTHALFAGDLYEAFRRAAEISKQVHIKRIGRTYKRVVALLDHHYDELWVGGKASYKLGSVIEAGGELIIYAPQLKQLSATHGHLIEKYGYAPLEQVREMVAGSDELRANLCVAAHLAHVSYGSVRDPAGQMRPRYQITLASGVSEAACLRVNLGFLDHRQINIEDYRADPQTLVVEDAGRDLYLV
ncbi:MAG TPA: lactate racemase domain-containing protein [Pyrinomonadaceae bacterium]|jgi:nickel-dependent lactate racemase|nr:lactate racemase domain-containing protein [Pyrinomonadaceae bacterium]